MIAEAANRLDVKIIFLDATNSPGKQITAHVDHIEGSFADETSVKKLADACDVLTIEIEHVNADALQQLPPHVKVEPAPNTIKLIQNKYQQKLHLESKGIAVAPFVEVKRSAYDDLKAVGEEFGYPFMLKSQTQAYDGRGNYAVKTPQDIDSAARAFRDRPLYAEKWSHFTKELAVVVVKTKDGVLSYPTVETVHEDSICKLVFCPPRSFVGPNNAQTRGFPKVLDERAQKLARDAVATFSGKGVFAVEMFLLGYTDDAELQVNEIAPRVHNSGHLTIEACPVSQFEAHLRAILDLPISQKDLRLREPAVMLNILGGASPISHIEVRDAAYKMAGAGIHLYGKAEAKGGRKMGHITVTAPSLQDAYNEIYPVIKKVDEIRASRKDVPQSTAPAATPPKPQPLVLVCVGSATDIKDIEPALEILRQCRIRYEAHVGSAHRTPKYMAQLAANAQARGFKVIIGCAGGSAHLPGMMAAETALPVIGLAVKASSFDGMDSIMSSLQMPNGTPVGLIGVGRGSNAGLLAARIVGAYDSKVQDVVVRLQEEASAKSLESDRKWEEEENKKQDKMGKQ